MMENGFITMIEMSCAICYCCYFWIVILILALLMLSQSFWYSKLCITIMNHDPCHFCFSDSCHFSSCKDLSSVSSVTKPASSCWLLERPTGSHRGRWSTGPTALIKKYQQEQQWGYVGLCLCGYGSIPIRPINTIFKGMNIHLPAILMFTRGTRFWHTAISRCLCFALKVPGISWTFHVDPTPAGDFSEAIPPPPPKKRPLKQSHSSPFMVVLLYGFVWK